MSEHRNDLVEVQNNESVTVCLVEDGNTFTNDQTKSEKDENKEKRWKVRRQFYLYGLSFMVTMAAYYGLLDLQSSMNIENGLGTASLFVMHGLSACSAILVAPFIIDYLGTGKCMLLGYISVLIYIIANFFPGWWTLIPASALQGVCDSWIWAGNSNIIVYFGNQYSNYKTFDPSISKFSGSQKVIARYIGYGGAFINIGEIFGNGISHAVLSTMKHKHKNDIYAYKNNLSQNTEATWKKCGAKDCQFDYIFSNDTINLVHYLPDEIGIKIVVGVFLALEVVAIIIAIVFLPQITGNLNKKKEVDKEISIETRKISSLYLQEVKMTLRFIVSKNQLLMTAVEFHYGMFVAFALSEYTRAYMSCTVGIEMIGLSAIGHAIGGIVASWFIARIVPKCGRTVAMTMVSILHANLYVVMLFWTPTNETKYVLYILSFVNGVADLGLSCIIQASVSVYFHDNLAIAYSAATWAEDIGLGVGFAWSVPVCVKTKLIVLFGLLTLSYIAWTLSEITNSRRLNKQTKLSNI